MRKGIVLPAPGAAYEQANEAAARRSIEQADAQNIKTGTVFDKILMKDTTTGAVVALTVADGNVVVA